MKIEFDPHTPEDLALIRQIAKLDIKSYLEIYGATPTAAVSDQTATETAATEAIAASEKRGRGRPPKDKAPEAQPVEAPSAVTKNETVTAVVAPQTETKPDPVKVPDLFSIEEVRAKLIEYSTLTGGQEPAKDILEKVAGNRKLSQINSNTYGAVMDAINAAIAALPKKA